MCNWTSYYSGKWCSIPLGASVEHTSKLLQPKRKVAAYLFLCSPQSLFEGRLQEHCSSESPSLPCSVWACSCGQKAALLVDCQGSAVILLLWIELDCWEGMVSTNSYIRVCWVQWGNNLVNQVRFQLHELIKGLYLIFSEEFTSSHSLSLKYFNTLVTGKHQLQYIRLNQVKCLSS